MKQTTLFLKLTVFLLGLIVAGVCIFGLPVLIRSELAGDFDYGPIFLGLYVPAIPFFFALYQSLKLLNLIDTNTAFSENSVKALKYIKNCAIVISLLFAAGMPYVFIVADRDDAPGAVLLGLVIIFASTVITTFAALLQKLLQDAIYIKSENDLTI